MFCQFKKSSYLCNRKREKHSPKASQAKARQNQGSARSSIGSVSYTHLTLPTNSLV